ncbi:dynein intermediate chain 2, ciliary [Lycorma delicatula]|uniref:dynein intermediate chain 2, ciliary n=1 Tax=Lycorma delicatula TaxID=130591 RepID=UPI003F51A54E
MSSTMMTSLLLFTNTNDTETVTKCAVQINKIKTLSTRQASTQKLRDNVDSGETEEMWIKGRNLIIPEDQLDLTDKELSEELARVLTTVNPSLTLDLVQWNFKQKTFTLLPRPPHAVTLLEYEGTSFHKESPEALLQLEAENMEGDEVESGGAKLVRDDGEEEGDENEEEGEGEGEGEGEEEVEVAAEGEDEQEGEEKIDTKVSKTGPPPRRKAKKLTNQFNFCERAALTYNNPYRELGTQTIPPPRATFSDYVTQWIIYDIYQNDYEAQQREKEREKREKMTTQPKREEISKKRSDKNAMDSATYRMLQAAKILERMINQNTYDEIAQDYRYWEDPSDEYRDSEGTLLPLWKFSYEKTKKMNVTEICWNPLYYDLFGVTFGSFDFHKQVTEGYLCLFTMKNPSFPEYINSVDSGVMCLDFHPVNSYLVVIGLYDGTVSVYNVQLYTKDRQFQSNSVTNKHGGIVWQVCWGPDLQDGEMNFYSVSSDGKVFNWVLMQNELAQTLVITLYLEMDPIPGPDGTMIRMTGCGTAIAFHPKEPLIFLVGTEEGHIYKCSTAYASIYLYTYHAHHMPVHRIDFNKFAPEIFISCSSDWRVKIWEDNRSDPLFMFDLGCSVGDVKWAPYSSTVFAAVTVDGKCHVFDLNVNKYKAICIQNVVSRKRNKLTRLAFNYKLPIIMLGDDKGSITTVKLSPNLRIKPKPPKKQQTIDPLQLEIMKLEKLLALVREPQKLTPPVDAESTES